MSLTCFKQFSNRSGQFAPPTATDCLDEGLSFEGQDDVDLGPAFEESFDDQRVGAAG